MTKKYRHLVTCVGHTRIFYSTEDVINGGPTFNDNFMTMQAYQVGPSINRGPGKAIINGAALSASPGKAWGIGCNMPNSSVVHTGQLCRQFPCVSIGQHKFLPNLRVSNRYNGGCYLRPLYSCEMARVLAQSAANAVCAYAINVLDHVAS